MTIFAVSQRGEAMNEIVRETICEVAGIKDIGELSDGFHTFNSLYEQRMILFAALVKAYRGKAWKSYRHEDGEYCFGGGWFIVGIDTPEGSYTYHYENKYWDMFDCIDLPRSPHWDGHTESDAETRLMSLEPELANNSPKVENGNGDLISRQAAIDVLEWFDQTDPLGHTPAQIVRALPTAEPRTGKWLSVFVDGLGFNGLMFECSECGKRSAGRTNFCAYCGADMRGERNEP